MGMLSGRRGILQSAALFSIRWLPSSIKLTQTGAHVLANVFDACNAKMIARQRAKLHSQRTEKGGITHRRSFHFSAAQRCTNAHLKHKEMPSDVSSLIQPDRIWPGSSGGKGGWWKTGAIRDRQVGQTSGEEKEYIWEAFFWVLSRDFIACVCMCVPIPVPVITSISFSTIHFIPKTLKQTAFLGYFWRRGGGHTHTSFSAAIGRIFMMLPWWSPASLRCNHDVDMTFSWNVNCCHKLSLILPSGTTPHTFMKSDRLAPSSSFRDKHGSNSVSVTCSADK